MNNLSIERLKDFERDPSNNFLTRSEMMEAIKELIAIRELKGDQNTPTKHSDDFHFDLFASCCKEKLATARNKGRSGWDNPDVCSVERLAELLMHHLTKGNSGTFEDIANFAMMLHQRSADPKVLVSAARSLRFTQAEKDAVERALNAQPSKELKGDQVPVGWVKSAPIEAMSWDSVDPIYLAGSTAPVGWRSDYKPVYDRPQKPVVVLGDIAIHDDLHEVGALVSYDDVVAAIEAAGCIVQTGDTDTGDDHQSSAPAVLRDVLTAVSIGGSRTELIDALTAIKPKFGAPGSRDVDVRAAHVAIDKAIEKLSNL